MTQTADTHSTPHISVFTLLAYRPDGVDGCRGLVWGTSPSDLTVEVAYTEDDISKAWAQLMAHEPIGQEFSATEYTLLLDGRRRADEKRLADSKGYAEVRKRVAELTAQHLEQLKLAKARQVEEVARLAREKAEEAQRKRLADEEAAERATLELLQTKFAVASV